MGKWLEEEARRDKEVVKASTHLATRHLVIIIEFIVVVVVESVKETMDVWTHLARRQNLTKYTRKQMKSSQNWTRPNPNQKMENKLQKIYEAKLSSIRGKVSVPDFGRSLLRQSWTLSLQMRRSVMAKWNPGVGRKEPEIRMKDCLKCGCEREVGQRWKKYGSTDCTIGRPECSPTGNPSLSNPMSQYCLSDGHEPEILLPRADLFRQADIFSPPLHLESCRNTIFSHNSL